MIGRREWLRKATAQALAAWAAGRAGGISSPTPGQSAPTKKSTATNRYTVRKPALSKSNGSTRTSPDDGSLSIRADEQLDRLLAPIRGV